MTTSPPVDQLLRYKADKKYLANVIRATEQPTTAFLFSINYSLFQAASISPSN